MLSAKRRPAFPLGSCRANRGRGIFSSPPAIRGAVHCAVPRLPAKPSSAKHPADENPAKEPPHSAKTPRIPSPYFASLLSPTPLTFERACNDPGRSAAIWRSVASWKMT